MMSALPIFGRPKQDPAALQEALSPSPEQPQEIDRDALREAAKQALAQAAIERERRSELYPQRVLAENGEQ